MAYLIRVRFFSHDIDRTQLFQLCFERHLKTTKSFLSRKNSLKFFLFSLILSKKSKRVGFFKKYINFPVKI